MFFACKINVDGIDGIECWWDNWKKNISKTK